MTKADLKKEMGSYAARQGRFDVVSVPVMQFLMIDGHGDPNTAQAYRDAIETLFPAAYALKFFSKKELDRDYGVMPLEGLWWSDDMEAFVAGEKSKWKWTAMIMVPEWITAEHYGAIVEGLHAKGGVPALDLLRMETFDEGLSLQTLHVGSYEDEAPVIAAMHHEVMPGQSLRPTGKHHEIYLSDARRTAPEKLKTIVRQPVIRGA